MTRNFFFYYFISFLFSATFRMHCSYSLFPFCFRHRLDRQTAYAQRGTETKLKEKELKIRNVCIASITCPFDVHCTRLYLRHIFFLSRRSVSNSIHIYLSFSFRRFFSSVLFVLGAAVRSRFPLFSFALRSDNESKFNSTHIMYARDQRHFIFGGKLRIEPRAARQRERRNK